MDGHQRRVALQMNGPHVVEVDRSTRPYRVQDAPVASASDPQDSSAPSRGSGATFAKHSFRKSESEFVVSQVCM